MIVVARVPSPAKGQQSSVSKNRRYPVLGNHDFADRHIRGATTAPHRRNMK
jgi:hypothetical protein